MALRIKYNAPVILSYALLCTAVLFIDRFTANKIMQFFVVGGDINLNSGRSLVSLFTHIIGHANIEHLLGNMTLILLLGPIAEEKYGSFNILIMILATAFITGILNALVFDTGLIGASGIVFMLILLVSFTNVDAGQIPLTFILVAFLFIGKEILASMKSDQVSQYAHIIGGFCGAMFGFTGILKNK
jgi:membrane associated rhomboid family serine protease